MCARNPIRLITCEPRVVERMQELLSARHFASLGERNSMGDLRAKTWRTLNQLLVKFRDREPRCFAGK